MTLQQQREDGHDGDYRVVCWDDEVGHAVIWEYGRDDRLRRRGIVTHWPVERWQGEATGEVVWQDATGEEVERRRLTTTDAPRPTDS